MPKCTIDGKEIEVPPGTTVIQAALQLGIEIPHFCWHPDLPVDGNCRMCLVEIEKMPKLQIACNTAVTDGMVVQHGEREGGPGPPHHPRVPARQPPHRLPGLRPGRRVLPAGPVHGARPPRLARSSPRRRSRSARWWTSGPIMLDAERCVLCSRCLRFERDVTGTNSFEFREPRRPHRRSRPSRTGPSPTTTRATWPTSARWARCSPTTSASRCGSGSWRRRSRCAPAAPPAATSSSTTATARCTACGRGATSRSTSPGCATSAAWSTRRSRWRPA